MEDSAMKFLSLFLVFVFLFGCKTTTVEEKNPIEGTWEMVSAKWSTPDTTYLFPVTDYDRQILMISRTHHVWIRQDTSREGVYAFGGGKYTLGGDNYTELLEIFFNPKCIGKSVTFTMKVKGDTLIQSGIWPAKKFGIGEYDMDLYEVYKRLD
jgi:hypothetical protein